jgi:hypothetical protein
MPRETLEVAQKKVLTGVGTERDTDTDAQVLSPHTQAVVKNIFSKNNTYSAAVIGDVAAVAIHHSTSAVTAPMQRKNETALNTSVATADGARCDTKRGREEEEESLESDGKKMRFEEYFYAKEKAVNGNRSASTALVIRDANVSHGYVTRLKIDGHQELQDVHLMPATVLEQVLLVVSLYVCVHVGCVRM